MRSKSDTLKLPASLISELGGHATLSTKRTSRNGPAARKVNRKADRSQKKVQRNGGPPAKRLKISHSLEFPIEDSSKAAAPEPISDKSPHKDAIQAKDKPKSIFKKVSEPRTKPSEKKTSNTVSQPAKQLSRVVRDKFAEDDAQIAALEKRLGLKGKKALPKSFRDDGLEELLLGLDYGEKETPASSDGIELRARKRRRPYALQETNDRNDKSEDSDGEDILSTDGSLEQDTDRDLGEGDLDAFSAEGDFASFTSDNTPEPVIPKRIKENPYVAPGSQNGAAQAKYIPPSLRKAASTDSEFLVRLRRQLQGLVNRLTETNLISILGDVEELYRNNARQHVTSTLVDLLLISVCEPTSLPDTLIILPAGFIAAVYKIVGTDFGAQVVQRIVELFSEHYGNATARGVTAAGNDSSKETSNLISLLSELYNFQVVSSTLMFDYIRLFLDNLSELNAELLLKVIRMSGPQLRQDDPSSLKDIVSMLRPAIAKVGEVNLSVRTKFMIETINDLKNNKMKTGAVASAVVSEHTIRMKKCLGTLNTRNIKASEPLRIGLKDIQDSDKRGKWWLVGASWLGNSKDDDIMDFSAASEQEAGTRSQAFQTAEDGTADLVQLAREQRMNTDIRRAIFICIMSSSDYEDAYHRLLKLKLKKVQELEIPKVLIHCAGAEASYNPFYTLIARKLCGDRKVKMAFQFSLWDTFKRMGESDDETADVEEVDEDNALDLQQVVNWAKMFGFLVAENKLNLNVLKILNLSYLQPSTKTFMEIFLITVFLRTVELATGERNESSIVELVAKVKQDSRLVTGLLYFTKKIVSKTDIAGGKLETTTVKWASRVAVEALQSILSAM